MDKILEYKLTTLKDELKKMGKVAIAYSGGVDSNFLLKVAKDTLGDNVLAITINAMMHSTREIKEANNYAFLDINKDYYNKMKDKIKKEIKNIEIESRDNQEKYKKAIEKVLSKVEYYDISKKLLDLKIINGDKI